MAVTKFSRQRVAIKEYLIQTKEHPTADSVYMSIREVYPNISLGTVYRNLSLLVEQGEILKINCRDGSDRFDGNPVPHNHFICNDCGRVIDLMMESIDHINAIANTGFDGRVDGHVTFFFGVCPICNKNNDMKD
ncbi:MAG TPA: transcriptional repressor [Mobilitalea sp.]|nr:transcriptional repressor [Mobilitalea sp.]